MSLERVMVVSHGHPDLVKGGAELAAHHTFRGLATLGHEAVFLARTDQPAPPGAVFSTHRGRELLFHADTPDYFCFRAGDGMRVWRDFRDLLQRFAPDVVHFHHYTRLGIECLREVRITCPKATIVLTLHEFLAICNREGQMVKQPSMQLCYRSSPAECTQCFPGERSPADFFMRELYIKSMFECVDVFVAPSEFLAERYRAWGLPAHKIRVLENPHPLTEPLAPRALKDGEGRGRFAFFGQVSRFKGIEVLLQAFALLPKAVRKRVRLDIHASNIEQQSEELRMRLTQLLEGLDGAAAFRGPYEPRELPQLMAGTDWVVVPSIWWENSPMVIQEAFNLGRPVIAANIGGMAEKVHDGVDGLHFQARSPQSLADVIERASSDSELWNRLRNGIRRPPTVEEGTEELLRLYRTIAQVRRDGERVEQTVA